jgi:hypothetical protein
LVFNADSGTIRDAPVLSYISQSMRNLKMSINQKLEPRALIEDEPKYEEAQAPSEFYMPPRTPAQSKSNGSGGYVVVLLAALIAGYLGYSYFVPGNYSALMTNHDATPAPAALPATPPATTTTP